MAAVGVLLPVRIETRFKAGDLWVRVVPDEPWFVRGDLRVTADEVAALQRYVAAPADAGPDGVPPAWRDLAVHVGAPRAVYLHRLLVTTAADGTRTVRTPNPSETRGDDPVLPRIVGFPSELVVSLSDARGPRRAVVQLTVNRARLLVDFADPDLPGDRRWWEDWDEALAVGVAGIIPAADFDLPIDSLYVSGLGDGDPKELFSNLAAEGRIGLLEPGQPTNSLDGAPAAPLAPDADTWWALLQGVPGASDVDVSRALTGDSGRLSNMPGGDRPQRAQTLSLTAAMWPALWGFAASQVFDVARGLPPARWVAGNVFPEGAYPIVRIGSLPYGLLPTTSWSAWTPADGDPALETPLIDALLRVRSDHAQSALRRGTVAGQTTDGLLQLIGDTPTSSAFRYRFAWPLELWWLAMVGSGLPAKWRTLEQSWTTKYALARELDLNPLRQYGAVGRSRRVGLPFVLPSGVDATGLPELLRKLADAATTQPASFASTSQLEQSVLGGQGASLLLRLAIRSLQLSIGDLGRTRQPAKAIDLEPFSRRIQQRSRLEQLIATVTPADASGTSDAAQALRDVADAVAGLAAVPVSELERMTAATIDCATHRIDPWLIGPAQRRLDALQASGSAQMQLGAYGWVDGPAPGHPGPTGAGLLHAPSVTAALTAAVLRDRAVSDGSGRWNLDVTSRTARTADRLAEHVRTGTHLAEAVGSEIERIVGRGVDIEQLRQDFPVRTEHAGRRVCDGLRVLAEPTFPVQLDAAQTDAVQQLRDGLDAYADLLVAGAVYNLVEGRAEAAGAAMDGAAGLSRPPELTLLRTPREGRAVSSSVVIALAHLADATLPTADAQRSVVSPMVTIDPSVAAFVQAQAGAASAWDFDVVLSEGTPLERRRTVHLSDLSLVPADALALTRTRLEALAVQRAAALEGVPVDITARVTAGTAADRYERASTLIGLLGRTPADANAVAEDASTTERGGLDAALVSRYLNVREIGLALARVLQAQVALFAPNGEIGSANVSTLQRLLTACSRWGIAPDPPRRASAPGAPAMTPETAANERLVDQTLIALAQLGDRLTAAPDAVPVAQMSAAAFSDAVVALVSPTGQIALTGTIRGDGVPPMQKSAGAAGFDATWLTVVAAVRPALARLEAHQLTAAQPLVPWANRSVDPWQTNLADLRRLVAIYAIPSLALGTPSSGTLLAVAALDRFSEVIPSSDLVTGAAFGFDAPASRPQQAILLAVPPDVTKPLDQDTLVQVLFETRELAHARMARPADLNEAFRGLAPTALVPASGAVAIPLERRA